MRYVLHTGQTHCYDSSGKEIACGDTGHDGEFRMGTPWPAERFECRNKIVRDHLTGLSWSQDANIATFPCTWQEALVQIEELNRDEYGGHDDWRLPNRNELRSLVSYQTRKPALPENHPFINVFLGWYWSSTTAAIHPAYSWSVHLEGARMFYGRKDQYQLFWPVRGEGNSVLAATGQLQCFDEQGESVDCFSTKQDGALRMGGEWPEHRFSLQSDVVHDHLTGFIWARHCDVSKGRPVNWQQALHAVQEVNKEGLGGIKSWRLPNINELASLVDCSTHSPALSQCHPFTGLQDGYWSSTTSFFETDWAWVLYMDKGTCGVGYKPGKTFYVWPVASLKT